MTRDPFEYRFGQIGGPKIEISYELRTIRVNGVDYPFAFFEALASILEHFEMTMNKDNSITLRAKS